MHLGLIRHGQTEWNAAGRIQGQTDIPLSEQGILQAHKLAARLLADEHKWDAIIASDLGRAQQTAAIIAQVLGIPHLPGSVHLRERYFGLSEGTTLEERLQRWGDHWREVPEVGLESDSSVAGRVDIFMREFMQNYPMLHNVLIVSHGSFLSVMFRELVQELDNQKITNVSLSIFHRTDEGRWVNQLHNCTKHLVQG